MAIEINIPKRRIIREASLTSEDLVEVNRCRRPHNRLGFGYQIGFTRLLNRLPKTEPFEVVEDLLTFASTQMDIPESLIGDYQQRRQTISEHQRRVLQHLHLKRLDSYGIRSLEDFVLKESCRLEEVTTLESRALSYLKESGILQPAEGTLSRIIGEQRKLARDRIFQRLADGIEADVKKVILELLNVEVGKTVSPLQQIKDNPAKASPEAMLALMDKMAVIEATRALDTDVSWLNGNYQRALFHYIRRCSADRLREVTEPRRTAALLCFLRQSYLNAVDQAVDMFDKLLTSVHSRAENELDEQMRRQKRTFKKSVAMLSFMTEALLDESLCAEEKIEKVLAEYPKEELEAIRKDTQEWVSGKKSHTFHSVIKRFSYFRRFTPVLLRSLDFAQESTTNTSPCLEAIEYLKELNSANKRKLSDTVPTAFIPKNLRPIVIENGKGPDKHAWECALLVKLRDEIKDGNLFVKHSKRFARFDDYFMPDDQWKTIREGFFKRSALPLSSKDVPAYLENRLNLAYDAFLKTAPTNSYATVTEKGWELASDPAEGLSAKTNEEVKRFRAWFTERMRRIRLPDLLIEVDNHLRFSRHFMPLSQGADRNSESVAMTLAAIMAKGCNIGNYTMEHLISGITYKQLKRISDWQLNQESQRAALAELVDGISSLDVSLVWGEGRTSASDGQRFALPRKVLQQTYSTKFSDFALEFYTFVADNYAPYYSLPKESAHRDGPYVLDGVLYNESDLMLEEHYTDTHGYTEINFAAFAMLAKRFCPRIRDIKDQRIYRIDLDKDYGPLSHLVNRPKRNINPEIIAEQWDKMGQFYASLESGHTTASVALKRLVAFSEKNRFYRANLSLGRVLKTEFILEYLSQPALRKRIRRGLLKVEELHQLARDVFYARRGRINAREMHEQMTTCSCLTLIVACIIYWQAKEMARILRQHDPSADGFDASLLEHLSPIGWDNVILYGQYNLNRTLIR